MRTVMKKILVFGIENEFEGIGTLYFDLNEPQRIADYIKSNIEHGQKYEFIVKEMDEAEFKDLE
jgi:hypothetical protein